MVSLCKAGKCALFSQWTRVSTDWMWTHGEGKAVVSVHWPGFGIRVLVCKFLPRDAELGDELTDMLGVGGVGTHRHNSLRGSPLPHCAIGECVVGSPLAGRLTAGRDHAVLSWTEACGWLLIPVNQRHYGDLKIFLVSLQIVVIMVALSKLESRAKGTFMLECRRFTNS